MKLSQIVFSLLAFTFFTTSALGGYGEFCGTNTSETLRMCYQYHPTRALEIRDNKNNVFLTLTISRENAVVVRTADGEKDYYKFENAPKNAYFMVESVVVEEGSYPGDGESRITKLEALLPDGSLFSVTEIEK